MFRPCLLWVSLKNEEEGKLLVQMVMTAVSHYRHDQRTRLVEVSIQSLMKTLQITHLAENLTQRSSFLRVRKRGSSRI